MITDFIINPNIRGLRANDFGSRGQAVPVSKTQSVVDISGAPSNGKISEYTKNETESPIKQEAFSLSLSEEGKALSQRENASKIIPDKDAKVIPEKEIEKGVEEETKVISSEDTEKASNGEELTEEEKAQVQELKARDTEVRAHEQAHLAAAGPHARGGVSFEYENGPDGAQYAVGGHVDIDVSKVANDPAATIAKAQQVRQAAMAPASPSSADKSVAASATKMEMEARQELREEQGSKVEISTDLKTEEDESGNGFEIPKVDGDNDSAISGTNAQPVAPSAPKTLDSPVARMFGGYQQNAGLSLNIVA